METARMALAPRRDLVGVPSREIILWSTARWSAASSPAMDLAISLLALATALRTPLPRYFDLSPSRSSSASCSPVEAPEGTAARPSAPPSRTTSASTVGLPRESMTWRARTLVIFVDMTVCSPVQMRINDFTEECHGVPEAGRENLFLPWKLDLCPGAERLISFAALRMTLMRGVVLKLRTLRWNLDYASHQGHPERSEGDQSLRAG